MRARAICRSTHGRVEADKLRDGDLQPAAQPVEG
jgi:hypothetical protein